MPLSYPVDIRMPRFNLTSVFLKRYNLSFYILHPSTNIFHIPHLIFRINNSILYLLFVWYYIQFHCIPTCYIALFCIIFAYIIKYKLNQKSTKVYNGGSLRDS